MYTTTTLRVAGKVVAFTDHRPPYERKMTLHLVRVDGVWRTPTPAEQAQVPDDWWTLGAGAPRPAPPKG